MGAAAKMGKRNTVAKVTYMVVVEVGGDGEDANDNRRRKREKRSEEELGVSSIGP
jgi:hypothetical protein